MSSLFVYLVQHQRVAAQFEIKAAMRMGDSAHALPEVPVSAFKPDRRGRRFRVCVIEAESEGLAIAALRVKLLAMEVGQAVQEKQSATVN